MNSCFQILSYSFQNLTSPRALTNPLIKKLNYRNFNYPDVVSFDKFSKEDTRNVRSFQKEFREWFSNTLSEPIVWQRVDRGNDLQTMIRTISKVPKNFKSKERFQDSVQEDAVEFMDFLLKYNPWESLMTVHEIKQFLVKATIDTTSFEYIKDVDDPYVYGLINVQKASENQGNVVKLQDILQHEIFIPYPDEYTNEKATKSMVRHIERNKKQGEKLYKMAHIIGCESNKYDGDQLPMRLLIKKLCHNGIE